MIMYSIIDIETTGLNSGTDRITEIAIIIHDGEKIVDQFETLINPECHIPHHITGLTGINDRMVRDAPRFYEVARKIVELTEGKVFVAHNASFDYNFLKNEFRQLFFNFNRKTLCTKKLCRKLIPGMNSYGLGNLCKSLEIQNPSRHRAGGDALATVRLLEYLLKIDKDLQNISLRGLSSCLPKEQIMNLPESPGVYYFLDENNQIIYIGKSVNIKSRILSHLSNNLTKRAIEMRDRIASIHYELTGSELVAQLLESSEIKKHRPLYNRMQRRSYFHYGLFSYTGSDGYIRLNIEPIHEDKLPLTSYSSRQEGRNHLMRLINEYELCQKLCGLYKSRGACFQYQLDECHGACIGKESTTAYNDRVIDAITKFTYKNKNFFILDDGRKEDEISVIKIENGRFIGFGYIDIDSVNTDHSLLHDVIKHFDDNRDVHVILRGYLRKNNFEKIIIY
jgi:DNA polymerase-3 subunit epsilon